MLSFIRTYVKFSAQQVGATEERLDKLPKNSNSQKLLGTWGVPCTEISLDSCNKLTK